MINLKEDVSQATEEGKMLKLRLHCARVEVDKRHKVRTARIALVPGLLAQLNKHWNIKPRVMVSNPM